MAKQYSKPEPLPENQRSDPASRDDVRLRWVRTNWYWGPICPQTDEHGAMVDLKGSDKWYCRHQGHTGRGTYTEEDLLDLEWSRLTSVAPLQQEFQHQSPELSLPPEPQAEETAPLPTL